MVSSGGQGADFVEAAPWDGERGVFFVRLLRRGDGRFREGGWRCGWGTEQVVLHGAVVSPSRVPVAGADRVGLEMCDKTLQNGRFNG